MAFVTGERERRGSQCELKQSKSKTKKEKRKEITKKRREERERERASIYLGVFEKIKDFGSLFVACDACNGGGADTLNGQSELLHDAVGQIIVVCDYQLFGQLCTNPHDHIHLRIGVRRTYFENYGLKLLQDSIKRFRSSHLLCENCVRKGKGAQAA